MLHAWNPCAQEAEFKSMLGDPVSKLKTQNKNIGLRACCITPEKPSDQSILVEREGRKEERREETE